MTHLLPPLPFSSFFYYPPLIILQFFQSSEDPSPSHSLNVSHRSTWWSSSFESFKTRITFTLLFSDVSLPLSFFPFIPSFAPPIDRSFSMPQSDDSHTHGCSCWWWCSISIRTASRSSGSFTLEFKEIIPSVPFSYSSPRTFFFRHLFWCISPHSMLYHECLTQLCSSSSSERLTITDPHHPYQPLSHSLTLQLLISRWVEIELIFCVIHSKMRHVWWLHTSYHTLIHTYT